VNGLAPRARRRRGTSAGTAALVLSLVAGASAQAVEEYTAKAAFLLNFARFTEWPSATFRSETEPLLLCVVGTDPFGPALDSIEKKSVRGRELAVDRKVSPDALGKCQVAFISKSQRARIPDVLRNVEKRAVLTVSDIDDFARKGGIIGLLTDGGKIRFEINVKAAERAGLKLSSQLLKLASVVGD
jgi:hypothetical protein